ncbi:cerebellin-3-like [Ruditapes philippinarum]|uniref:cerebellin-3-like n=1 Tax=Ruditapes philippinarum TaxID=129788 RepID=UPI00295BF863|nr:cerebellin-3-like [Ruditapes philippinarum]
MFFLLLLFICISPSKSLEVTDGIFSALVEKLSTLDETVQRQEKVNNEQDEIIRYLTNQNEELLKRLNDKEVLLKQLDKESTIDERRRFVLNSEGPVAFSAVIDPTVVDHTKANTAIKFETILTEYGGGYNNDTGIFVAPNTGLYLLSCSMLDHTPKGGHGGVMIHGEIMRNHDVLARVFAHAETTYRDQGANTIIATLTRGDQVWVRTVDNSDLGLGGSRYTSFSGYLLWQLS